VASVSDDGDHDNGPSVPDPFDRPLAGQPVPSWFWSACEMWTALEELRPEEVRRAVAGLDEDDLRKLVYVQLALRGMGFGEQ
jgi:hypothetical protein